MDEVDIEYLVLNAQTALRGGDRVQVLLAGGSVRVWVTMIGLAQAGRLVTFDADEGGSTYLVRVDAIAGIVTTGQS